MEALKNHRSTMQSIFDPSVNQTIELIEEQVMHADSSKQRVTVSTRVVFQVRECSGSDKREPAYPHVGGLFAESISLPESEGMGWGV